MPWRMDRLLRVEYEVLVSPHRLEENINMSFLCLSLSFIFYIGLVLSVVYLKV